MEYSIYINIYIWLLASVSKLPPDSVHENIVDKEDRSESSCDSYVTLLTSEDNDGLHKHYNKHNSLCVFT